MSYGYGYNYYPAPGGRTQIDWGNVQFSNFSNVQYSRPEFSDAEDDAENQYQGETNSTYFNIYGLFVLLSHLQAEMDTPNHSQWRQCLHHQHYQRKIRKS